MRFFKIFICCLVLFFCVNVKTVNAQSVQKNDILPVTGSSILVCTPSAVFPVTGNSISVTSGSILPVIENRVSVCSPGPVRTTEPDDIFLTGLMKIIETQEPVKITIHHEKVIGAPTPTPKPTMKPTPKPTKKPKPTEKPVKKISMAVPADNTNFKAFMPYTALSSRSKQGILQKRAITGEYGIRHVDGRMCVAVGTYYGLTGTKLDITLSNGTVMKCIVGDSKADCHTDSTNRVCRSNGSILELIVDMKYMNRQVKRAGSYSALSEFSGDIVKIEKIVE